VFINFWIFSRFTVDDAFITWRYGKNLIDFGVWNYNPSTFDPTQAYTNPIYAALSIVPAALHWNVVLFFKFVSLILAVSFVIWFVRVRPQAKLPLLVFFAVPATMIHLFSGLETFLYVVLVFALFVALRSSRQNLVIAITLGLFVTRPESWLLVVLVPLYLSFRKTFRLGEFIKYFIYLAAPLGIYFYVHLLLFGQALPNTFFVKSGQFFVGVNLLFWLLTLLPLFVVWVLGFRKLSVFGALFTGAVAFNYSTAFLSMDFAYRYVFHLVAPLVLFVIYLLSESEPRARVAGKINTIFRNENSNKAIVAAALVVLGAASLNPEVLVTANYYPKLLAVHGELGRMTKEISKTEPIRAISIGDAGLLPYVAELPNLDLYRLGTHLGAAHGISQELINRYEVDFAVLRGYAHAEEPIRKALRRRGLEFVCAADFGDEYRLQIWFKKSSLELREFCDRTNAQIGVGEWALFVKNVQQAPWSFWK